MEMHEQRIEHLKKVISRADDASRFADLTPRALEAAFDALADLPYRIGFNYLYPSTYAAMLHRLDDLRPEVRSAFASALMTRLAEAHPVREAPAAAPAVEATPPEEVADEASAPVPPSEVPEPAEETPPAEAAAGGAASDAAPAEKGGGFGFSPGRASGKEDLFDRFLTWVAALTGRLTF